MIYKEKLLNHVLQVFLISWLFVMVFPRGLAQGTVADYEMINFYPAPGAAHINPDVQLHLTFPYKPLLGKSGIIRIYEKGSNRLIDSLDMRIPPGPKNTRTLSAYEDILYEIEEKYNRENTTETGKVFVQEPLEDIYQKKYLGGNLESDVYHFYPILVNGNVATICPRNNRLEYNKQYYIQIDTGIFYYGSGKQFQIADKSWEFSTKKIPPSLEKDIFVVSTDGSADFNTVQGAIDYMPESSPYSKTIFIRNGRYEEIVYFRNKENIKLIGESRNNTIICYANNGFFNPRPTGERVEMIERFRNRRSVFAAHNTSNIEIMNLSILSIGSAPAQAEGLLVRGDKIYVNNVTIDASGDALQATGRIYMENVSIKGFGDNVLGYGAVYFKQCDFISTYGPHLWPRNTFENHGNVLVDCVLRTEGDVQVTYSRAPIKAHYSFPNTEAILIDCAVAGVKPEGWGLTDSLCSNAKCYEFNTVDLNTGEPIDASGRVHYSKQLVWPLDSVLITNYRNPTFVLDGWTPQEREDLDLVIQEIKSKLD